MISSPYRYLFTLSLCGTGNDGKIIKKNKGKGKGKKKKQQQPKNVESRGDLVLGSESGKQNENENDTFDYKEAFGCITKSQRIYFRQVCDHLLIYFL
jgi:hypothetical protein